jgi:hypothetical protein
MAPRGFFGKLRDALVPSSATQVARAMQLQARMFADSYNTAYSLSDEVSPLTGKKRPYDFSIESLAEVDQLIDDLFRGSGLAEAVDPALFVSGAGAYFGEVIARSLGGQWAVSEQGPEATRPQVALTAANGVTLVEAPFDRVAERMRSKEAPRLEASYRNLQARQAKGE